MWMPPASGIQRILSWAWSTLTGVCLSSGQGMCSPAVLIFVLPWTSCLQEEAQIHSILVGCRVGSVACESLLNLSTLLYLLSNHCFPLPICYFPALRLKNGWVARMKAVEGWDQRLQGRVVLFTPPCWVWKEEEKGLCTSGEVCTKREGCVL